MRRNLGLLAALALFISGCADTQLQTDPECQPGETRCDGNKWQTCADSVWQTEDCGEGKFCKEGVGCLVCEPGTKYCVGLDIFECSADGLKETKIDSCKADQQCAVGQCFEFCDLPNKDKSNVGCEFWSVDLPNEYYCISLDGGATCTFGPMGYGCAACQQFAVAIANTSEFEVTVTVEINEAKPGEPLKLSTVSQTQIARESLEVINLPMREVDCTEWYTDTTGNMRRKNDSQSCLSSRAYRITSSYPVVAYQFNPIINDFSNGASLLIPTTGLDDDYYVLGWSTSNPISLPIPGQTIEGTPDYTNVTIVGVSPDTKVDVTVTHMIQGSADGKIPAAKKGETFSVNLGPFDVLNVNSLQDFANITGDMTGTRVKASKPVAVFSGGQRASVPVDVDGYNPKPPEPDGEYDVCCTEHFEQQMFPISSLGKTFVITRTPIRSKTITEPDFYRILATKDGTKVTTSLSNFPSFTLSEGQVANFWSVDDFVIESDKPIMIAQYAVAQGFLDSQKGAGGDPEFVVFPPVEQYREEYLFLTPPTFDDDFVVIATPSGAMVKLDGKDVTGEFSSLCQSYPAGTVNGESYNALRCPVEDGVHKLESTKPVGIMVYGYYSVGSYGYPGGADVKVINID